MVSEIFRHYQRTRQVQRLVITIPVSIMDWIDTGLHPCIIGTRPVACGWKSKTAYPDPEETLEAFRRRIRDIRVRFVHDPSVSVDSRCFVTVTDDVVRDPAVLAPMQEMTLDANGYSFIRFPMEPGRIQMRLAGSKPTDKGTMRVEFGGLVAAPDDWFIMEGSSDKTEFLDIDSEEFPALPPLPDP